MASLPIPSISYLGPVIFEKTHVLKTKPRNGLMLSLMKEWRAEILEGKKVFPMYLP